MGKERLRRIFRDPHARGAFFLYFGAAFHFLYGGFRLFTGILYRAFRVDATAFFYLSLALSRIVLLRAYRDGERGARRAFACRLAGRVLFVAVGIMMLLIAETLSGRGRAPYPFYALLVSGGYAITSATLSTLELLYLGRLRSPILSASRAVSLASAVLSVFNFLTDVFSAFALRLTLGALTLFFVLFFAVGLSVQEKSDA